MFPTNGQYSEVLENIKRLARLQEEEVKLWATAITAATSSNTTDTATTHANTTTPFATSPV